MKKDGTWAEGKCYGWAPVVQRGHVDRLAQGRPILWCKGACTCVTDSHTQGPVRD